MSGEKWFIRSKNESTLEIKTAKLNEDGTATCVVKNPDCLFRGSFTPPSPSPQLRSQSRLDICSKEMINNDLDLKNHNLSADYTIFDIEYIETKCVEYKKGRVLADLKVYLTETGGAPKTIRLYLGPMIITIWDEDWHPVEHLAMTSLVFPIYLHLDYCPHYNNIHAEAICQDGKTVVCSDYGIIDGVQSPSILGEATCIPHLSKICKPAGNYFSNLVMASNGVVGAVYCD